MTKFHPLLLAPVLAAALALSGCGVGSPATEQSESAEAPSATATPAQDDFCAEYEANSGTLASIGAPPAFYPKEQLVPYAEETLKVMSDLEPPADIASQWATYKDYHQRLLAAAQQLGAGQTLQDPSLVTESTELADDYEAIEDWLSANC